VVRTRSYGSPFRKRGKGGDPEKCTAQRNVSLFPAVMRRRKKEETTVSFVLSHKHPQKRGVVALIIHIGDRKKEKKRGKRGGRERQKVAVPDSFDAE